MTPDVNVLTAASRNDNPRHTSERSRLERAAATSHLGQYIVSFDRDFRKLIGGSPGTLLEADAG